MMLYRDDYYNKESEKYNICEIIIAKHRKMRHRNRGADVAASVHGISDKARSGGNYE